MDVDGLFMGIGKLINHPDGKIPCGSDVRQFINGAPTGIRQRKNLIAEYVLSWILDVEQELVRDQALESLETFKMDMMG